MIIDRIGPHSMSILNHCSTARHQDEGIHNAILSVLQKCRTRPSASSLLEKGVQGAVAARRLGGSAAGGLAYACPARGFEGLVIYFWSDPYGVQVLTCAAETGVFWGQVPLSRDGSTF